MPADMKIWRTLVIQAARSIANKAMQRRAWFGIGPEVSSPTEEYCQFFDNAAVEEYLIQKNNGLTQQQTRLLQNLVNLMDQLQKDKPDIFKDDKELIDDPQWDKVRKAAQEFLAVMGERNYTA